MQISIILYAMRIIHYKPGFRFCLYDNNNIHIVPRLRLKGGVLYALAPATAPQARFLRNYVPTIHIHIHIHNQLYSYNFKPGPSYLRFSSNIRKMLNSTRTFKSQRLYLGGGEYRAIARNRAPQANPVSYECMLLEN
jgi:hypothetical protein